LKSVQNYIRTDVTREDINLKKLTAPRPDGHPNCPDCNQNRFSTMYKFPNGQRQIKCRNESCGSERIV
jgi:hypothetical protein